MGAQGATASCPSRIEFGAMLEVPSLAEMLDLLLPRVDFLSIGTNDLTQFLFAADRADPRLAAALRLAQPGDPALPEARGRRGARGRTCRCGCAARWPAGRSRRWR